MELRESSGHPSEHAYQLCIAHALDKGETGIAKDVLAESLGAGYFEANTVRRMLPLLDADEDRDLEAEALWALTDRDEDVFCSALALLLRHETRDSRGSKRAHLKGLLIEHFEDEYVPDTVKAEAWPVVSREVMAKPYAELTDRERSALLFAVGERLLDLSSDTDREACQQFCEAMLDTTPDEGFRLATTMLEADAITPDLALRVIEVAKS